MVSSILRVRRQEKQAHPGHLLIHIDHIGPKQLDLKLIGTDHSHLYHASLDQSSLKSLQASNFTGDLQQWKTTIAYAFLHQTPPGPFPDFLRGVELVAKITRVSDEKGTVTITVRRNIGGITQTLGSLDLEQDDTREEVGFVEWVDVAAATADDLRLQLDQSLASSSTQQDRITQLTAELDQLVKAKREHEDELLSKFAALLNTKKLKIRDQQRLLSRANVNAEALDDVRSARGSSSNASRKAGASRGAKRKAKTGSAAESEDEDVTDEGGDEDNQQETPSNSDEEATEHDDECDSGFAPAPPASQSSARALRSQTTTKASQAQSGDAMEIDDEADVPSRRELPFGGRKTTWKEPTPPPLKGNPPAEDGADDEETDDEL
ncbi:hypothetical protein TI39_contig298g00014 [Zymoseptoria brevis]|uniref:Uncharacterized protein n=1 Tax=Zymoseptoria brevis TaxID=1047168 RepID=A0A0F4GW25_9PEZI|nr:hypothetical protein TI39_contig298g00014 [Zymoseptoria brevis]